jgi:Tol biopolymer transport system component
MMRLHGLLSLIVLSCACTNRFTPRERLMSLSNPAASAAQAGGGQALVPTIAFTSTRDFTATRDPVSAEIYVMNSDGTNQRRITFNDAGDGFANLSPDGRWIVFDSNRLRAEGEPLNTSDLFLMRTDGSAQVFLTRGSSPSWSADGKSIAFHRSASGTGQPIKPDPGAATIDNDIFIARIEDLQKGLAPTNITNSPQWIDDDPDWSPAGQRIAFTRHALTDDQNNSVTAEIYVINVDGTGLTRLTTNGEEERAPAWSPDGRRIVYSCRKGSNGTFETCVMNADGSRQRRLSTNTETDLSATFSPDGKKILFQRRMNDGMQLFTMNADGTSPVQLTAGPGRNLLAHWGVLRVDVKKE